MRSDDVDALMRNRTELILQLEAASEDAAALRSRLEVATEDVATLRKDLNLVMGSLADATGLLREWRRAWMNRNPVPLPETEAFLAPAVPLEPPPLDPYCELAASEIPGFGTNRDKHRCPKLHRDKPLKPEAAPTDPVPGAPQTRCPVWCSYPDSDQWCSRHEFAARPPLEPPAVCGTCGGRRLINTHLANVLTTVCPACARPPAIERWKVDNTFIALDLAVGRARPPTTVPPGETFDEALAKATTALDGMGTGRFDKDRTAPPVSTTCPTWCGESFKTGDYPRAAWWSEGSRAWFNAACRDAGTCLNPTPGPTKP